LIEDHGISDWVDNAPNESERDFREAVHTILSSIASDSNLKANMVIKGGILLAVRYQSHRYTKDIDFSTTQKLTEVSPDSIEEDLNKAFKKTAAKLEYDMDCIVQSCKVQPANKPDASFPSVKISVGYARKGSSVHQRLLAKNCPKCVSIDYSLNELMPNIEKISISDEEELNAYTLTDLIAEKLRSMLQQKKRNRARRQDIFDLVLLLDKYPGLDDEEKQEIFKSLIKKSEFRDIDPEINSLDDPEIRERAAKDYPTLADEIEGDLPDFDETYDAVNDFYKSLPWK